MNLVKSSAVVLGILLICMLPLATALASDGIGSDNFRIPWSVLDSGGGEMASSNFRMQGTVSQALTGVAQSDGYIISSGYWPGVVTLMGRQYEVYLPLVLKQALSGVLPRR